MTATSIEWTDASWNPVRGCARVSAGCENCYAENVARRFAGPGMPYEGLVRIKDGKAKAQWNGTVRFIAERLADPLTWKKPKRVFVNSMSDLFHDGVSFEQIAAIFGVMASCPQHTFQVLTKRPDRARELLNDRNFWREAWHAHNHYHRDTFGRNTDMPAFTVLPNVWLGVSVEDQASADKRIPHLLECPAAVRWVSYEPAIGPVDFTALDFLPPMPDPSPNDPVVRLDALRGHVIGPDDMLEAKLDWVVVGGESGPGARPFDLAWARSVIAQCAEAGTACFVKQLGAQPAVCEQIGIGIRHFDPATGGRHGWAVKLKDRKGGDMSEWPADLRVRQWPGESR